MDSLFAQANGISDWAAVSGDGRIVAFQSAASNLVLADTNGKTDVFVRDLRIRTTRRVSLDSIGVQGNDASAIPSLSSDGRFVVFQSSASNLVAGDSNGVGDIFVHDLLTGATVRASVSTGGAQGNGSSFDSSLSADGRFVAFGSHASTLVFADTNGRSDAFVRDALTGVTARVSIATSGAQANDNVFTPAISADGRFVAFSSYASSLIAGDTNNEEDVFVHDRQTGITSRVSVDSLGFQANGRCGSPSLSADGHLVVFSSDASNLVPGDVNGSEDVYCHDRQTGTTSLVSLDSLGGPANGESWEPGISADGRIASFASRASDLVTGDLNGRVDVFARDLQLGLTWPISVDSLGVLGDQDSDLAAIAAGGRHVAFRSAARNLVPGDTNNHWDVFLRDVGTTKLDLLLFGSCPGSLEFSIANASASGSVALLHGPAGAFVKPSPPCAGLVLGMRPPKLHGMFTANASGVVRFTATVPSQACGLTLQAVDVASCSASNVVVL